MQFSFSVPELTELCGATRTEGSTAQKIHGIASLRQAQPGDLSFLGNAKYRQAVPASAASVILLPEEYKGAPRDDQVFLRVTNPSLALAKLCRHLEAQLWPRPAPGVHPSAIVDPAAKIDATAAVGPLCVIEAGATIGARTWIEAGSFVGRNVAIGADCRLFPGVRVLAECVVGQRVWLHSGVVIGSDGFGYETVQGRHEKIPQVGNVVLHDDVEVGANSTIDRARFSSTIVGEGTKIDNLVQVGHNVVIGRYCILCALVGIAGTTNVEDYVVLGGQAGLGGHLTVGRGSMIAGGSGITSDLPPKSVVKGNPPLPLMLEQRLNALRKRLPELFRRVDAIEETLHIESSRAKSAGDDAPS